MDSYYESMGARVFSRKELMELTWASYIQSSSTFM